MLNTDIYDALQFVSADCDYETWLNVGMALKDAGCDVEDWDNWSKTAPSKYHPGECHKKWRSFRSSGITASTIFYLARENGWNPDERFTWEHLFADDDERPHTRIPRSPYSATEQLRRYIATLFRRDEKISYCLDAWFDERDQKWKPSKGQMAGRPVSDILDILDRGGSIEDALGTPNEKAGAWVRFNPVSGEVTENGGIKDSFVTDYRYALVESDNLPIDKQYDIIRKMKLPVAAVVKSGGKSVHAIVKIMAADEQEYKKRVDTLYKFCEKNGLHVDKNNKNPSRLSRLPGIMRGNQMQELIDINIGCPTWDEWLDLEDPDDPLPDWVKWSDIKDNLPNLEPEVIPGVLRQGHKMMVAAASKAGKSFLMIELAVALAEGLLWLGFQCKKSRVLYVNFEIAGPSFDHRVADVYNEYGVKSHDDNLIIWNLRGKSMSMHTDEQKKVKGFDTRLIRRVLREENIDVIIIDPIYKVLDGDENSAADIRDFCNSLDKICEETSCCTIYVHHHSKGSKWGVNAIDRAAGSGVFGRDADATVDLIEIPLTKTMREDLEDDLYKCKGYMVTTDLREFESAMPRYFWFKHPLHVEDKTGLLEKAAGRTESTGENDAAAMGRSIKKLDKDIEFNNAVDDLTSFYGRIPTPQEVVNHFDGAPGWSLKTIKRMFDENGIERDHEKGRKTIGQLDKSLI